MIFSIEGFSYRKFLILSLIIGIFSISSIDGHKKVSIVNSLFIRSYNDEEYIGGIGLYLPLMIFFSNSNLSLLTKKGGSYAHISYNTTPRLHISVL